MSEELLDIIERLEATIRALDVRVVHLEEENSTLKKQFENARKTLAKAW